MCQAILRLKYYNSRDVQVQVVEDIKDLEAAVKKAQEIPTVNKVYVYVLSRIEELQPVWKTSEFHIPSDLSK